MRDGFIAISLLTPTSIASGFLLLALCKQLSLRLIYSNKALLYLLVVKNKQRNNKTEISLKNGNNLRNFGVQ